MQIHQFVFLLSSNLGNLKQFRNPSVNQGLQGERNIFDFSKRLSKLSLKMKIILLSSAIKSTKLINLIIVVIIAREAFFSSASLINLKKRMLSKMNIAIIKLNIIIREFKLIVQVWKSCMNLKGKFHFALKNRMQLT